MSDYLERSKQLIGEEKINSFSSKVLLIVGIGGVGGTALEALARSGFKKFIIIDSDLVDITNLNRQILFTKNDVGQSKVEVAKRRIKSICDDIIVECYEKRIGEITFEELEIKGVDFIVDAIDDIEGKMYIYKYALENNIPFISSLGMGNRIDPEQITITKLSKTENDPLAKKLRYELRKQGVDIKLIPVVFSEENPIIKCPKPTSMMMVPSTAGLLIAKYVINTI